MANIRRGGVQAFDKEKEKAKCNLRCIIHLPVLSKSRF